MEWLEKSDAKSRFFVAESTVGLSGSEFSAFIEELLLFVAKQIIGNSSADYDSIFLEVNCDTGRVILSPSTEERRASGNLNGCAVWLPRLQDFWYDLDESGVTGDDFSEVIRNEVVRIGKEFGIQIENNLDHIFLDSSNRTIDFVVFGSEPEKVLFRRRFQRR